MINDLIIDNVGQKMNMIKIKKSKLLYYKYGFDGHTQKAGPDLPKTRENT